MLEVRGLNKTYITKGAPPVAALKDVSLKLEHTGMVFVLGKSGSGKSTFLNVVGGLDKYDSGEIIIKGRSSQDFRGSDFDSYRNTYLGFIFQEYNLINEFTVGNNIALAMELQNRKATDEAINDILKLVELDGLADRMPLQISGGQRQRVAIARALVKDPDIIMADEPTGALDSATGAAIFQTLQNLSKTRLVLIVSHDREFAERYGDRIIEFSDGRIISDMLRRDEDFVETIETGEAKKVEEIIEATQNAGLSSEHIKILTKLLAEKVAEEGSAKKRKRGTFVDTTEEMLNLDQANQKPFNLIKSRLPQKNALKMARSSMKHKKIRLVFSIILSVIAVTLFGFSSIVGSFSEKEPFKSLIRDYGYTHLSVTKEIVAEKSVSIGYKPSSTVSFNESDEQKIKEITGSEAGVFTRCGESLTLYSQTEDLDVNNDYYTRGVYGLVGVSDFSNFGLNVPKAYGRYPEKDNEILITNYLAEAFMMYGLTYYENNTAYPLEPKDIKNINDVLSYNIAISSAGSRRVYKIVGIINLPIERYKDLKLNSTKRTASGVLAREFEERKYDDISYIYGLRGLVERGKSTDPCYNAYSPYDLPELNNSRDSDKYYYGLPTPSAYGYYVRDSIGVTYLGKDGSTVLTEPKEGEIIINLAEYNKAKQIMSGNGIINDDNNLTQQELTELAEHLDIFNKTFDFRVYDYYLYSNELEYEFYRGNFEVVGVVGTISASNKYSNAMQIGIFNDDVFAKMVSEGRYMSYYVNLKSDRIASQFIDEFAAVSKTSFAGINRKYNLSLPFANDVYSMSSMFSTFSMVFFWMSIVLCIFAALLLLNFISASVTHKKKEIGILRAIGARKVDVMSIFLWEGILIGLIVLAISIVLVFVTIIVFNNVIGGMIGLPFTMLVVGILPIFLMILVCFATIGLASILPSRRVASLRPMDAIRSL